MAVTYVPFDGEQVSREWSILLHDIRYDDHIAFHVNEGHRTMARQWYFWNGWLLRRPGFAIAAFPSPNAPHIRTGRRDHAIDFNNAEGVRRAAAKRGVVLKRTVLWPNGTVREEWHLEANCTQLLAYAGQHATAKDPVIRPFYMRPFRPNNRDAVTRLQRLLHALNMTNVVNGTYNKWTRRAVRGFQAKHGLKVDGVVGPGTWIALRKAQK